MAPGTTPFNCLTFRNSLNPTRFLAGTKPLNNRWDFTQKGVEKKLRVMVNSEIPQIAAVQI
jgi:hypothetical protein